MTGWQLAIGGTALLALGYGLGGQFTRFTPASTALLSALFLDATIFAQRNGVALVLVCTGIWPVARELRAD